MDIHVLTVAAVSAAITTVVNALLIWLWALFKNSAPVSAMTTRLRAMFKAMLQPPGLDILLKLMMFILQSSVLYLLLLVPTPPTRFEILAIVAMFASLVWFGVELVLRIAAEVRARRSAAGGAKPD